MIDFVRANLVMPQGGLFEQPINVTEGWQAKDITGCTARMQIREFKDSVDTLADYDSSGGTPRLFINPAGQVIVRVPGDVTATYDWGDAWYDIELDDGPFTGLGPVRLAQGRISLSKEVTR